jgi:hypothetical protein
MALLEILKNFKKNAKVDQDDKGDELTQKKIAEKLVTKLYSRII